MGFIRRAAAGQSGEIVTRLPFFYGWVVMVAGTLGIVMTSPGQTYTVSIFIEYFIEDLGISRSLVSTLYSVGTLAGSFTLPFWGRIIDRKGSRVMVAIIAALFGLACIYMGFIQTPFMLLIGFILVRMLGQGALGLVSQNVINQWWVRRRGMVIGISGLLMAVFGMGAFPNLVYGLISALGWRYAYGALGLALLLLMAPLGFLLFRNRPEDHQLEPDGVSTEAAQEGGDALLDERQDWTLKEAMRTRAFWVLLVGMASFGMLSTGLFFHMVSFFDDRGLDVTVAASVFLPVALAAAVGNLAAGFLIDRIPLRFLLSFGLLLQAASLVMVQYLAGTTSAFVYGAVLGLTNGIARTVGSVGWPTFFGRTHLGSIYGFTAAAGVIGAAIGPLPFGVVRDVLGTYQPALFATAAYALLLALLALSLQKPSKGIR